MFLDLYSKTLYDENFKQELSFHRKAIAEAEKTNDKRKIGDHLWQILSICQWNPSLLVPYFFPRYPGNEPLDLFNRPFSVALLNVQAGGFMVVRGSRQIGKSTAFVARQEINAHLFPNHRSIYIAPHSEHVKTYARRMAEMYRAFTFPEKDRHCKQNLYYREFSNGATIELVRVLTSADEARGKTADEMLYDEYQLFDSNLEPELEQVIKASKKKIRIYGGTSTTIDSPLEVRWQDSSQATWHIRLPGGGWLDCGDKDQILKAISPKGLRDPKTSQILDVTKGEYVHGYPRLRDAGMVGLHIPQVIIPEFAHNPLQWADIWQSFNKYETSDFLQEILGIPTAEGEREITEADLKRVCCLTDGPDRLQKKASKGRYAFVVSGCDWGGSDYNPADRTKVSYTVHLALGVLPNGFMDIIYMRRYSGMDYREIANSIAGDHKRLKGYALGSDFGVGAAYNMLLRESPNVNTNRHLIFNYSPPKAALLAPPKGGGGWYNQFSLNRTEAITSVFNALKATPQPKIRCYNWTLAENCLSDILNMYRVVQDNAVGNKTLLYRRHAARPDDSLHALVFAYTTARLLLGQPLIQDPYHLQTLKERLGVGSQNVKSDKFSKVPPVVSG